MQITQPTLIKAPSNWYIEYYDLDQNNKKTKRHQLKCGLNRIKDLPTRERQAQKEINTILAKYGKPIVPLSKQPHKTTLIKALDEIMHVIEASFDKEGTVRTYRDMISSFKQYLTTKLLHTLTCDELTARHIHAYFDYLVLERKRRDGKKLSNTTYNNHKTNLRAVFNKLKEREYIKTNFFTQIENKKESEPVNRPFEPEERDLVMQEIFNTDSQLTYAVLLIYRCGLRSFQELAKMKPKYFDFKNNILRIEGYISKTNERDQFVTIPSEIAPWLQNFMKDIPKNWYILGAGKGLPPSPDKHFQKNALYERHKKLLHRLKEQGRLHNIEGLTIYGWKHTGAFQLIDENAVDPETLRNHLRHKEVKTTQRYFKSRNHLQPKILNFKTGIIPQ